MPKIAPFLLVFMAFYFSSNTLQAQSWDIESIEFYNSSRLKVADKILDDAIDLRELMQDKNLFLYFRNHTIFNEFDLDKNAKLTLPELIGAFRSEEIFLNDYWQKQLNELGKTHTPAQLLDTEYLKKNMGLLLQLVQNSLWLRKNDHLLETIFTDINWLNRHAAVVRAFSDNLHYFASKPHKAMQWYKMPALKDGSPNFMLFRQLHIRQLSQNQQIKKML